MAQFRRFNVGNSGYANYDTVVVDRSNSTLVFISLVGYTSIINGIAKDLNRQNNCYIEGCSYSKTVSDGYVIEKRRQSGSDFVHMIAYRKDTVNEIKTNNVDDERLIAYVYCRTEVEKVNRLYDKLYKNTAVPILKEWIPFIINQMKTLGYMQECSMNYDSTKGKPFQCFRVDITKLHLIEIVSRGLRTAVINVNGTNTSSVRTADIRGLDSYLNSYGEILAGRIQQSFVPKFVPGESDYMDKVEDYDDSCYDGGIEIYEAQKAVIQASVNNLNRNDVTYVIGEMGTGKTLIGAGIVYAHNKSKNGACTVVLCPAHLTNKWKREIERLVPNGKGYIIKTLSELLTLDSKIKNKNRKENMFIIISKESAKFGYEMKPAAVWSNSKRCFVCPECGKPLIKRIYPEHSTGRNRYLIDVPFSKRDFTKPNSFNMTCPNTIRKWSNQSNSWEQTICGAKLWVPHVKQDEPDMTWVKLGTEGWIQTRHVDELFNELAAKNNLQRKDSALLAKLAEKKAELATDTLSSTSKAPRKYPLAKYIRNYYKGFVDYLIADELHLYKGDTEQGQAFGDLTQAAKNTICLTGTLLNGYADGLFYILYRTLPRLMKQEGFSFQDEANFMRSFGVIRRTSRFNLINGRESDRLNMNEKRLPGVSPLVFTKFLLENAVFLSLSDMAEGLPAYEEIPTSITMDAELQRAYNVLETDLRQCLGGPRGAGLKAMGAMLQSLSVYPDMPYNQPPIIHPDTGETLVVPPTLPTGLRTKENELLRLVQEKIENDEKVLVYYQWTNRTDLDEKLGNMFRENNIQVAVLESKVSPEKREEWIEQQLDNGIQVLICNPTLVETGLDLLAFTTIVFYEVGYNIFTMRQASRRSWRLSQTRPIQVYFFYYHGTIQEQALSLMATKLQASMAIEGRFSEEGLRAMSNNEDLLTQIANSVVNGIQQTVDAEVFRSSSKTTTASRTTRIRKRRKDLEIIDTPSHMILSYLLRPNKQSASETTTHRLIKDLTKRKQHVANLF